MGLGTMVVLWAAMAAEMEGLPLTTKLPQIASGVVSLVG